MFVGSYFTSLLTLYSHTKYFSLPIAAALGFISVGMILPSSAIIVHILKSLEEKVPSYETANNDHRKLRGNDLKDDLVIDSILAVTFY